MMTSYAVPSPTVVPLRDLAFPEGAATASADNPRLRLIAGDASDRKFYRLENSPTGAICMRFPKWEGGYGGDPLSWLGMHRALEHMAIPVPAVLLVDEERACIWTEDFGDDFLNCDMGDRALDSRDPACARTLGWYRDSLDLLVKAQYPAATPIAHPAQKLAFDFEKLMFEMRFFMTHFLKGFLEFDASEGSPRWTALAQEFEQLAVWLGERERVLCHRDYHVRNVMISEGRVKWIDFQDARMGPHTYDLVSLVRDSYVRIAPETREQLYRHYFDGMNAARRDRGLPMLSEESLREEVLHMGLQRNVKAIGSFGYLATVKGKPGYLSYVRHTLETLTRPESLGEGAASLRRHYPAITELLFDLKEGSLREKLNARLSAFGQR